MATKRYLGFIYGLFVFVSIRADAGPAAPVSIPDLVSQADAIVLGSAKAQTVNGAVSATIQVEQVIKGSPTPGVSLSASWTLPVFSAVPEISSGSPASSTHGIFFLRQTTAGTWQILPAITGDVRWRDVYVHVPANPAATIVQTALSSLPSNASALDKVLLQMVVAEESAAPVPFDLISIYRQAPSPVLAAAFSRFTTSSNPALVAMGIRGAMLGGDFSAIVRASQEYATLSSAAGWHDLLVDIRTRYSNSMPQAIQALGQIADNSQIGEDLRWATAVALARAHTAQSLPYLAQLLSDPDIKLESAAVGGLSSYANNVPVGSHEPAPGEWKLRTPDTISHSAFDERIVAQNQSYYVDFWKTWWQQYGPGIASN